MLERAWAMGPVTVFDQFSLDVPPPDSWEEAFIEMNARVLGERARATTAQAGVIKAEASVASLRDQVAELGSGQRLAQATLEQERDRLQAEIAGLRDAAEVSASRLVSAETERDEAQRRGVEAQAQSEGLRARQATLEQERDRLQAEIAGLRDAAEVSASRLVSAETERDEAQQRGVEAQAQSEGLRGQATLEQERDRRQAESRGCRQISSRCGTSWRLGRLGHRATRHSETSSR